MRLVHYDTRSKGHDYSASKSSGSMEYDMFNDGVISVQHKGIHFNDIAVDGDSKLKKLTRELNANDAVIADLGDILLRSDKAHAKKNLPKRFMKFKKGWTEKYCRLLTDKIFQYALHEKSDSSKSLITNSIRHSGSQLSFGKNRGTCLWTRTQNR